MGSVKLQDSMSYMHFYSISHTPRAQTDVAPIAKGDDWDSMAAEYKKFAAGPSTNAIKTILERANATLPFSQATGILDNGCGPGPIISALLDKYGTEIPKDCTLMAADFSEGMVKQVEASKASAIADDKPGWDRLQTKVLNAMDMQGVPDASQSHITAGWVYFMTPSPQKCLSESLRILKPAGILAASSWEGNQWIDIITHSFAQVRPDKQMLTLPEAWSNVDLLKREFEQAGFRDVQAERVQVYMQFERHEVLAEWLLTKMPPVIALTKDMSDEEMGRLREVAVRKCREMCPSEPGELSGVSLLAIGRK